MGRLVGKLRLKKDAVMQWHTQARNNTTNLRIKVYFTLPALSATNFVTCNCHVDDSSKGRYGMILGRDLFTKLVLNLKCSEHVIKADDEPFKGYTTHMVDLGTYLFKSLNAGGNTPEEYFINDNAKEVYESEHVSTATKRLRVILYAK